MRRTTTLIASFALLAAGAAGCGGSDGDDLGDPTTGLAGALASVADSGAARTHFEWVDRSRLRAAISDTGGDPDSPEGLGALNALALGSLNDLQQPLGPVALDLSLAEASISIGDAPNAATRADGIAVDDLGEALTADGYDQLSDGDGRDLYGRGEQGGVEIGAEVVTPGTSRVAIDGDAVAISGFEESIESILGGQIRFSENPQAAAIAGCLADPLGAILYSGEVLNSDPDIGFVGAGVLEPASAGAAPTERLCATVEDPDRTEAFAAEVERALSGARDPLTNLPFSDRLDSFEVEASESGDVGVLSVTLEPSDRSPGYVIDLIRTGSAAQLLGGEPASPVPLPGN